ncbi:putative peroxisomal dehydratase [Aspergillus pseudoustus]|uniref:Peroxisomal dehydratase n=1 Tax=Aspergillus pseudoustus TaxID=1810923 RepID=A0ABR4ITF4_9EURO
MQATPTYEYPRKEVSWLTRDALLFNLSIGAEPDDLHLIHESYPQFQAFPTYATVLGHKGTDQDVIRFKTLQKPSDIELPNVPRFDRSRIVDGEKRIVVHKILPHTSTGGRFYLEQSLVGLYDKGQMGTIIETETRLVEDLSRTTYATIVGSVIARGQGGWGGPKAPVKQVPQVPPSRSPDFTVTREISPLAPALYRLNGDYNPLHIDPASARTAGFPRPILHGLCTWNMAAFVVVKAVTPGRLNALREFQARFSAPVYPGDVLTIRIWCMGQTNRDGREKEVRFVAVSQEGRTVLSNGVAVLGLLESANL